jgi:hypothetical protein
MNDLRQAFLLISLTFIVFSCRTLNRAQTTVVKGFAGNAKEVSDLPYRILVNYCDIRFRVKQLVPENYQPEESNAEGYNKLPEFVLGKLDEIKAQYMESLGEADDVRTAYQLLQVYIGSLENLATDKYSGDFERKAAEMGNRMNDFVKKLNDNPKTKVNIPLNPGQWLASMATLSGRKKLKTKQADMLRAYINETDTLIQAMNHHYQETQAVILVPLFEELNRNIRDQMKRSIAPYLRNLNLHYDSATSIVAIEFYSRINPVYYELTDEIDKNLLLIERTRKVMQKLADTHSSMKAMFTSGHNWLSVLEEVDGMKEQLFVLKDLFSKQGQEKFSFYKNLILQNEKSVKDMLNKR